MPDDKTAFALTCRDRSEPAPVLTRVQAEGRLDAVLFELTLRQTYRNTSEQVLEVVYTFPLPPMVVLLGFASELNGQRQEGVIVARRQAEQQYEAALEDGDAPVMLEAHADGLHTANIGNLKPGDEVVLEARFAQLIAFEQGRLRLCIPTTIAPRYGNAEQAGLQPQQVPLASLAVEYPLDFKLTIGQALAGAGVECPTHRSAVTSTPEGTISLQLAPGAAMDRDVVLIVTPREPSPSLLVRANDAFDPSAPTVLMAAMRLAPGKPRERIALKLLVDCSGSMGGDSISSARAALRGIVAGLAKDDRVSLSRFGSRVQHLVAPSAANERALQRLRTLIDGIEADLGGTEMEAALSTVLALPTDQETAGADVLLITDGEIWQADEMIASARRSGHRVFAIGVGSAPAEGVLRSLAEATGGACEFATPGEALEAAAQRMLGRMRQPVHTNARVDWGATPVWVSGPAPNLFGGDTAIAIAGFASPPEAAQVRLLADDTSGTTVELARAEADAPCPGDSLARIAAARRIGEATEADTAEMAVQYQLMSEHTNCILVHRRAEADRAAEQAELQRVSSMLAAGWGGVGSVAASSMYLSIASYSMAAVSSPQASPAPVRRRDVLDRLSDELVLTGAADAGPMPVTLEAIAREVADHLAHGGQVRGLAAVCDALPLHADARQAIDAAVHEGLNLEQVWLLLAHWINTRSNGLADASLEKLTQPLVSAIDPALVEAGTKVFERCLGGYPVDGWTPLRTQRLWRAMVRV